MAGRFRGGRALAALLLTIGMGLWAERAGAQGAAPPAPMTSEEREAETQAAWAAAEKVATRGPANVKLLDQGELALPEGFAYVPGAEAARILRSYGNVIGPSHVGLVTGVGSDDNWIAVIRFIKEGYIKDDDAKDWNADELLANLKQGAEESNEDRVRRGFPKIQIIGWVEKPTYDSASHRLVWSLASKREGEPDESDRSVNYNTYALGREGYFSLNLLTSQSRVEAQKPVAHTLLGALGYEPGKRYGDFNASTDQIAAYGLAALVGGVAAKKLGLIAVVLAFFAKFAKVGLLALFALGAGAAKLFGRKSKPEENAPSGRDEA